MKVRVGFILAVSLLLTFWGPTKAHADQTVRLLGDGEAQDRFLSPKECSAIRDFEKDHKQSFSEFLSELVTKSDFCEDEVGSCKIDPQQRTENYHPFIRGLSSFKDEDKAYRSAAFALETMKEAGKTTGIYAIIDRPKSTRNFIYYIFLDTEFALNNPTEMIETLIAPPRTGNSEFRAKIFRDFLSSSNNCQGVFGIFEHQEIRDVQLWIKSELAEPEIRMCILEGTMLGLGISEISSVVSLLDHGTSRESDFAEYSPLETASFKVYYRTDIFELHGRGELQLTFSDIQKSDCASH